MKEQYCKQTKGQIAPTANVPTTVANMCLIVIGEQVD